MALRTHLAQLQLQICMLYASKWRQEALTGFVFVMQQQNVPKCYLLSVSGDDSLSFRVGIALRRNRDTILWMPVVWQVLEDAAESRHSEGAIT